MDFFVKYFKLELEKLSVIEIFYFNTSMTLLYLTLFFIFDLKKIKIYNLKNLFRSEQNLFETFPNSTKSMILCCTVMIK